MRIELPTATWAELATRFEEDAQTLTLAPSPTTGWLEGTLPGEPTVTVRTEVCRADPVQVVLTF